MAGLLLVFGPYPSSSTKSVSRNALPLRWWLHACTRCTTAGPGSPLEQPKSLSQVRSGTRPSRSADLRPRSQDGAHNNYCAAARHTGDSSLNEERAQPPRGFGRNHRADRFRKRRRRPCTDERRRPCAAQRQNVRSIVVSFSCFGSISPKPLNRLTSILPRPLKVSAMRESLWASSRA